MAVNLIECGYACTYRICTYFVGRRVSLQKLCVPADECQVHVCEKLKVLDEHARILCLKCDAMRMAVKCVQTTGGHACVSECCEC